MKPTGKQVTIVFFDYQVDNPATEAMRPIVLVVDDDPDLVDLYTSYLEGQYVVRTAYDGQQAVDQLADDVDIVVLDRRMPKLSGDEVLTEIRDRGCDCGVIVASAVGPDTEPLEGFDEYLTKPISLDELHERVEELVKSE